MFLYSSNAGDQKSRTQLTETERNCPLRCRQLHTVQKLDVTSNLKISEETFHPAVSNKQ
jgi:hypothetical protein